MLERSQGPGRSCEEAPGTGTRKAEQRPLCRGSVEHREAGAGGQGLVGCRVVEAVAEWGGVGGGQRVCSPAPPGGDCRILALKERPAIQGCSTLCSRTLSRTDLAVVSALCNRTVTERPKPA